MIILLSYQLSINQSISVVCRLSVELANLRYIDLSNNRSFVVEPFAMVRISTDGYKSLEYQELFRLKQGGVYHFFRERVLRTGVRDVFLAHSLVALIILITMRLLTSSKLLFLICLSDSLPACFMLLRSGILSFYEEAELSIVDHINLSIKDSLEN